MNIGIAIAAACGVIVGCVATIGCKHAAIKVMKRRVKDVEHVLNAFSRAYRDVLSDAWQRKVYRRVETLVEQADKAIGVRVIVSREACK